MASMIDTAYGDAIPFGEEGDAHNSGSEQGVISADRRYFREEMRPIAGFEDEISDGGDGIASQPAVMSPAETVTILENAELSQLSETDVIL